MDYLRSFYQWLGCYFCEPTTAVTDFMLSVFCVWCFFRIYQLKSKNESVKYWSYFLFFIGCSTCMGGLAHSLSCDKSEVSYKMAWLFMQLFSGLALFFAQRAVYLTEISKRKIRKVLKSIAVIQLVIFSISVVIFMDFKVVALNSFIGLLQLVLLSFPYNIKNWEYKALVTAGFLTSFLTIYVNRTKLSFTHWFNYNDISHVIIFASLLMIYKGIRYKHYQESLFKPNKI